MRTTRRPTGPLARAVMAGLATLGLSVAGLAAAAPASAVEICEQYGTTTAGNYTIQNNRWGTTATQCIDTTSNGFRITRQDGVGNTSGAPVSYPSIYLGCHYSNCSPGSPLPRQVSSIGSAPSSVSYTFTSGDTYNASYDIWLNPTNDVSGVQATEIMIWFNKQGSINPIGSHTGTAQVAGRSWEVWTGSNGANNVVSYISPGPLTSLSFDVMDFVGDTFTRGSHYGNSSWYLTSVQAGFEPWIGGVGLAVNSFSASVQDGGWTDPDPDPTETTPPPGNGACSAELDVVNSWDGGYQGEVTVTANGAIGGWSTGLSLGGATVSQVWNGSMSGSGSSVTVSDVGWNGSLAAGGSTTYGFIADGPASSSATVTCSAN